jgi:hypothetical protein
VALARHGLPDARRDPQTRQREHLEEVDDTLRIRDHHIVPAIDLDRAPVRPLAGRLAR